MWNPRELSELFDLYPATYTNFRGRAAIRVVGICRDLQVDEFPGLWAGADEHEFVIDIERRVAMRAAARVNGIEFAYHETELLSFDEPVPAHRFAPLVPDC
jgi:hypothetical protein